MTSTYDQLNGWGPDYDYWLALTARLAPQAITDLGCGTGQLTVLLAQHTTTTVGVDPDPAMLAVARTRPDHELVQWMDGYADAISTASTDLITMTSHVAQVFLTDTDWTRTLGHAHRALRPGGRLAFDTRNPTARGWQAWNPTDSRRSITTPAGPAAVWHEVTDVRDGLVTFATTTRSPAAGRRPRGDRERHPAFPRPGRRPRLPGRGGLHCRRPARRLGRQPRHLHRAGADRHRAPHQLTTLRHHGDADSGPYAPGRWAGGAP